MTAEETRLVDSAYRAKAPWYDMRLEKPTPRKNYLDVPQQEIDFCLSCPYSESFCDKCNGKGKIAGANGRPRLEIDPEEFRKALRLRKSNKELCAQFGIGRTTLLARKRQLMKENMI